MIVARRLHGDIDYLEEIVNDRPPALLIVWKTDGVNDPY